ncbi:N-formylglutamate amidohydrolase [Neptunicoccus cionae]|uniref:N-formylglutamate amidohydrolase n=1 Tax=Neptunicoccus cionae TaxID=2035344 RepID=A0A916QQT9_9RHOB|nr:N-formylglutamate amidohydrolase [Amylibacter cionae]GGA05130.1 N-formylglutamate amidohydrolase [Amylibacter cionae]
MTPVEYHLHLPETITCGAVFSSPHSGRDYPAAFLQESVLDSVAIRSSEDAFVDELFGAVTDFGAPLLCASAPRAYVDLNRGIDELDSAVIEGVRAFKGNPRVASGLGVIPRVVSEGRALISGKISINEAEARLERYYTPYHDQLGDLLQTARAAFGQVLLVDCHSMPHEAVANVSGMFGRAPDIVLGDRFGSSCDNAFVEEIESFLKQEGFRVARNTPFAGAYIAQAYGRPSSGQHCVQIEIDRSLYLDEKTVTKSDRFDDVRRSLGRVAAQICQLTDWPMQMAAE